MRHLEAERLAALDHAPPTADESAHLARCGACSDERDAFDALRAAAAQLRYDANPGVDAGARLLRWESLSTSLRDEGLFATSRGMPLPSHGAGRRGLWSARSLRAAAAVAALLGSAALGRLSANRGANAPDTASAQSGVAGTLASATPTAAPDGFASVDEATALLARAQFEYERASLWLAGNDTTTRSSEVYRARLAALDQMMAASRAALQDAPQDPLLNHYYRATYAAREATLQQLSGTLPVDQTIESY